MFGVLVVQSLRAMCPHCMSSYLGLSDFTLESSLCFLKDEGGTVFQCNTPASLLPFDLIGVVNSSAELWPFGVRICYYPLFKSKLVKPNHSLFLL